MTGVLVGGLALLAMVVSAVLGFRSGVKITGTQEIQESLRRLKLTEKDAKLYRTAGVILNRLINVTDLDGDLAADIVSPKTRAMIEKWMTEYKEELDRV